MRSIATNVAVILLVTRVYTAKTAEPIVSRLGERHALHGGVHAGATWQIKGKGSPYSITVRRVPELIPVLGSQPAGDVSHKPGGRLPLLSARPAVTRATLKRAATNFAAW